jgi:hypothetical protein
MVLLAVIYDDPGFREGGTSPTVVEITLLLTISYVPELMLVPDY